MSGRPLLLAAFLSTACDPGSSSSGDATGTGGPGSTSEATPPDPQTSTTGSTDPSGSGGSTRGSESGDSDPDPDSGSTGADESSTGEVQPPTEAVFVATGSVGRTIISTDDGLTWTEDQSDDPDVTCAANNAGPNPNCFEGTYTARGIAFDEGAFFVTYDWAREPDRSNTVRRSDDGVSWDVVLEPGGFGGIAAGNGIVVLAGPSGSDYVLWSDDHGASWNETPNGLGHWTNVRQAEFVPGSGGVFILGGDGNGFETTARVVTSLDGSTWRVPEQIPEACPSGFRLTGGFGSVGDRLVIVGPGGDTCHSDDAGLTWALSDDVGESVRSHDLVQRDDRLELWTANARHTTEDGTTWTSEPLTGDEVSVGPVARDPESGTYVAVTSGYLNSYDDQHFYRSPDGLAWTQLPVGDTVRSHPILGIQHGRVLRSMR